MRKTIKYEDLTDEELTKVYLDWNDNMANGFNGTNYPPDYPRSSYPAATRFTLNGKSPGFVGLAAYCKQRGIINE